MFKMFLLAVCAVVSLLTGCATSGARKVSYIEINSRGCYVCQRMDQVITDIEKEYGSQVEITSYSGTSEGAADIIKKYNIRKYPANIFLDDKGAVFFRYEGLLDTQAVKNVLKSKGVTGPASVTQSAASAVTAPAGVK